jgi:hypothetical protein
MENKDLRQNIASNEFQTITGEQLLKRFTDRAKRELSEKIKINENQLSTIFFELGIKLETLNKNPKSKNVTFSENFWSWFNMEFCRFSYMYLHQIDVEFERTKENFIQCFDGFFITQTIKKDLTELIKKRFL